MRSNFFILIILLAFCIPFTYVGCSSGSGDGYGDYSFTTFQGIAVDDLDDEGTIDIAVAAHSDEKDYVAVILNRTGSPGAFQPAEKYKTEGNAFVYSIDIGDLNDDGFLDIITENGRNVHVLFQDPTSPGDFLRPIKIFVGGEIEYLAIGDLNEDGFNDIAIAGWGGTHLSILFQDSTDPGIFLPLVSLGIESSSVAIVDIDGDSINDIAITGNGKVKLLFQDPGTLGDFFAPVILDAGFSPTDVKIGDLDKDGRPDLVIGNWGTSGDRKKGSVSVLLQDTANPGDFFPADDYNFKCRAREVSLGDLNDDGFLDIAVASECGECKITILFQDITSIGTFLPEEQYSCNPKFLDRSYIAIGDMNDDNFNDLIISEGGAVIRFQDPASPGNFLGRTKIYDPD